MSKRGTIAEASPRKQRRNDVDNGEPVEQATIQEIANEADVGFGTFSTEERMKGCLETCASVFSPAG
ncbi:MAG: hypothetical protein K4304_05610 [Propionicimonas sp.]